MEHDLPKNSALPYKTRVYWQNILRKVPADPYRSVALLIHIHQAPEQLNAHISWLGEFAVSPASHSRVWFLE
jgi:hypothetical protein